MVRLGDRGHGLNRAFAPVRVSPYRRRGPDWWIRDKISREKLTGLAPAALTLRREHHEPESRLDRLSREADVRTVLEDFNARVIETRRQLLGGPPVVTPTRDVEAEVRAWQERRRTAEAAARSAPPQRPRGWRGLFRLRS